MSVKFTGFHDDNGGLMQTLRMGHQSKTTVINIGATATSFEVGASIVRIVAQDVSCNIKCAGTTPTTATDDMLLPASVVEYIVVDRGHHVGCISATGGNGKLFITEAI